MKSIFKLLIYFIFFFAVYFLVLLCLGIDAQQLINYEKLSLTKKAFHEVSLLALIFTILYIGRIKIEGHNLYDFGFRKDKCVKLFLFGLAFGVGLVVLYNIFLGFFGVVSFKKGFLITLLAHHNINFIVRVFFLSIALAFFEELVFRGFIYDVLRENLPIWLVIIISSMIFAAFHFPINYLIIIGLFLGGLVLAYGRYLLDSIEFVWGLHFGMILFLQYFNGLGIVSLKAGVPLWLVGISFNPLSGIIGMILVCILFPGIKILNRIILKY